MDLMTWVLIVQLWSDPPPKIKLVYTKEYPSYEACMEARKEWLNKEFVVICGVKNQKETKNAN